MRKNHTNCVDKFRKLWYITFSTKRVVCFLLFPGRKPGSFFDFVPQDFFLSGRADTDAFYGKRTPPEGIPGFSGRSSFCSILSGAFFGEVSIRTNNTNRVNNAEAETGSGYSGKRNSEGTEAEKFWRLRERWKDSARNT